jgi:hypothetical protein
MRIYKSDKPSHYEVLGVHPGASGSEIRRAYHRAALSVHPDHGGTHADMLVVSISTLNCSSDIVVLLTDFLPGKCSLGCYQQRYLGR